MRPPRKSLHLGMPSSLQHVETPLSPTLLADVDISAIFLGRHSSHPLVLEVQVFMAVSGDRGSAACSSSSPWETEASRSDHLICTSGTDAMSPYSAHERAQIREDSSKHRWPGGCDSLRTGSGQVGVDDSAGGRPNGIPCRPFRRRAGE